MADQMRKDQKGGGQATGRSVPGQAPVTSTGLKQTDNGTGPGTQVPDLKRAPGVR